MSHALTAYYKRIIRRQIRTGKFNNESEVVRHSLRLLEAVEQGTGPVGASFASRLDLEKLLLDGIGSGPARPMSDRRRRHICAALKRS
jgi:putative addiction module CopG family antidote